MDKNIIISDREKYEKKIEKLKQDGPSKIHIVADFDKTLTPAFVGGEKICSFYEYLRRSGYFSEEFKKRSYKLFNKYHPYEIDPKLSIEEKSKKMHEWWTLHWKMMVEYGITADIIKKIIHKNKVNLRSGAFDLLNTAEKNNIPFLIFSAGIGEMIKELLRSKDKLTENIHIISNFFIFDKNGKATGYKAPVIHTFNKKEIEIRDSPYYSQIEQRKNVILLGDNIGDLGMSEGIDHDCIIKIGFLNENIEENLELFSRSFDVVIKNDSPMDFVSEILKEICSKNL